MLRTYSSQYGSLARCHGYHVIFRQSALGKLAVGEAPTAGGSSTCWRTDVQLFATPGTSWLTRNFSGFALKLNLKMLCRSPTICIELICCMLCVYYIVGNAASSVVRLDVRIMIIYALNDFQLSQRVQCQCLC